MPLLFSLPSFAKSNWKLIAIALGCLALFGYGAAKGYNIGYGRGYAKRDANAKAEIAAQIKQCEADKALTTQVSHDYQTQLSDLNARITRTKLMYASAPCVPITGTAAGHHAAGDGKLPGQHGIAAPALIDYAGRCEATRQQLNGCQGFITKVWGR